jgi:hypothetical protein
MPYLPGDEAMSALIASLSRSLSIPKWPLKVSKVALWSGLAAKYLSILSARYSSVLLQESGVESISDLRELHERQAEIIQGGPYRAWEEFRLIRERPVGQGGHPHLLPSDLANVESYKAIEDQVRAEMEQAKAALVPIESAQKSINALVVEANSL